MAQRQFNVTYQAGETYHVGNISFQKGVAKMLEEKDAMQFMNRQDHGFYVQEIKAPAPKPAPVAAKPAAPAKPPAPKPAPAAKPPAAAKAPPAPAAPKPAAPKPAAPAATPAPAADGAAE